MVDKSVCLLRKGGNYCISLWERKCRSRRPLPIASRDFYDGLLPSRSSVVSDSVTNLLQRGPAHIQDNHHSFAERQREDPFIRNMTVYLEQGTLPDDPYQSQNIAALSIIIHFTLLDSILYYIDTRATTRSELLHHKPVADPQGGPQLVDISPVNVRTTP